MCYRVRLLYKAVVAREVLLGVQYNLLLDPGASAAGVAPASAPSPGSVAFRIPPSEPDDPDLGAP